MASERVSESDLSFHETGGDGLTEPSTYSDSVDAAIKTLLTQLGVR